MQLIHFVIITQERRCIFSLQIVFDEDGCGETMMIITRFFVVPRLIRREILCHAHLAGKKTNVTQKGGSRNHAFVHVRVCRPMSQYNQRSMMMAAVKLCSLVGISSARTFFKTRAWTDSRNGTVPPGNLLDLI